jgi:serine/threonine protein phosphatase PrpC
VVSGALTACAVCHAQLVDGDRFCETCGTRRPDPRDHVELVLPGVAAVSNRGLRHEHNEDAFALHTLTVDEDGIAAVLAVLCDGVSRAPRPDLASGVAATAGSAALAAALRADAVAGEPDVAAAVRAAADAAAGAVADLTGHLQLAGSPACTFVAAAVLGGEVTVGWIGDSRAYWLPSGAPAAGIRLTQDDTWYTEAVAMGRMSAAEAAADRRAHALTAWLGVDHPDAAVHIETLRPTTSGVLVLCTDGLWNYRTTPEAIGAALPADAATDPLGAARELVEAALASGGRDNVTVAVLPLDGPAPASRGEIDEQRPGRPR